MKTALQLIHYIASNPHYKTINWKMKILNLYAGIGGNRKLWQNVDVTAVE